MHPDSALAAAAAELAIVASELGSLIDRLTDAGTTARGLAGATDWQARAATAFHETADAWSGDVSGLVCVAETARLDAAAAWHRVALMAASTSLDPLLPAGAR